MLQGLPAQRALPELLELYHAIDSCANYRGTLQICHTRSAARCGNMIVAAALLTRAYQAAQSRTPVLEPVCMISTSHGLASSRLQVFKFVSKCRLRKQLLQDRRGAAYREGRWTTRSSTVSFQTNTPEQFPCDGVAQQRAGSLGFEGMA